MLGRYGRKYPKAAVNWYVLARSTDRELDGVTQEISPRQAYIRCNRPFRLNEVVDVVINAPERTLEFKAEVVWFDAETAQVGSIPCGLSEGFWQG